MIDLLLTFLMHHPDVVFNAAQQVNEPVRVNKAQLSASFADMSTAVLQCYHKRARYDMADVVQKPWHRQPQYAADRSAVIRIQFTDSAYSTKKRHVWVAVMAKGGKIRAHVVQEDKTGSRADPKCELENWTGK